jgi:apolipoprotein N-acyltransferase
MQRKAIGGAVLCGAFFALAAPPIDLPVFAWLGLAALAFVLDLDLQRPKRAWLEGSGRGLAFGFGLNVVALHFVPRVIARFTPLPFVAGVLALLLLSVAQGLPWALAGAVRAVLVRARVPRPVAFAIAAYAVCFVPVVFPWTVASWITRWPALLQLADVIGERGVTALVALSAASLASAVRDRARPRVTLAHAAVAVGLPIFMLLQGTLRMRGVEHAREAAPSIRVGLVQPGIEATTRWDAEAAPGIVAKLTALTRNAEARGAQVTVWSESAYPYELARGTRSVVSGELGPFTGGVHGPIIAGAITIDGEHERFNAALAMRSDHAVTGEYDKLHLLWFGEEVPFATAWPWLRRTFARGIGLLPGDHPVLLDTGRLKAAPLICVEDALPAASREAASVHPNVLVDMSNDAWFAGSSESAGHLRAAIPRAIETRRDLVRAVNGGSTGLIDAAGHVRAVLPDDFAGSLVVSVALLDGPPTFYCAWGDAPTALLLAALALASRLASRRTKRNERQVTE